MRFSLPALAAAFTLATASVATAEPFTLDKSHTAITFQVDHLGYSMTHGRFSEFDAVIDIDQDDPSKSSVEFTVNAPSVNTGWDARDKHVRGPDFLNVEKHPIITFKSTKIEKTGDDTATMVGELTMNGETHEETFEVTMRKLAPSPFGEKKLTAGFVAEATIDRLKYNVSYGKGAISTDIPVRVDLEVVKGG